MLSTSVFDDEGVLISSDIIIDAPVTFRGPTGLDLFGYDPVEGLVDANGNPITGGGGTPGGSNTQLQYNNNNAFGGMTVTRDATSGGLQFQGQPVAFGFNDDANDGEPFLGVMKSGGGAVSLGPIQSFTDEDNWHGARFSALGSDSYSIETFINGGYSTSALRLKTGSGGLILSASGGLVQIGGTAIQATVDGMSMVPRAVAANTYSLSAYETGGNTIKKFLTLTSAATPGLTIAPPSGGTVSIDTTSLAFNSVVTGMGFTNNDDGEPSLFFKNASGAAVSVMIGPTFTSPSAWEGLKILSYADTVLMCAEKNGNPNNGVMFIKANILNLSTANGVACDHDITFSNGTGIKTTTTDANTLLIQAYDMDGAARVTFGTLTNGNTPSCNWIAPAGTTMILQPTTYKSADGTAGLASFSGAITNLTVKNGIVTAAS